MRGRRFSRLASGRAGPEDDLRQLPRLSVSDARRRGVRPRAGGRAAWARADPGAHTALAHPWDAASRCLIARLMCFSTALLEIPSCLAVSAWVRPSSLCSVNTRFVIGGRAPRVWASLSSRRRASTAASAVRRVGDGGGAQTRMIDVSPSRVARGGPILGA